MHHLVIYVNIVGFRFSTCSAHIRYNDIVFNTAGVSKCPNCRAGTYSNSSGCFDGCLKFLPHRSIHRLLLIHSISISTGSLHTAGSKRKEGADAGHPTLRTCISLDALQWCSGGATQVALSLPSRPIAPPPYRGAVAMGRNSRVMRTGKHRVNLLFKCMYDIF